VNVLAELPPRPALWRGYDDPALPEGIWSASGVVVGDASGGVMFTRILFHPEGAPLDGNIYNLEQLEGFFAGSAARPGFMNTVGMVPANDPGFLDRLMFLSWSFGGAGIGNSMLIGGRGGGAGQMGLPFLIGTVRGTADDVGALDVGFANVNLEVLAVTAMGYRWGPRSVMAPGGPQRPIGSIFGA